MPATEFLCRVTGHRYLTPTVFEVLFDTENDLDFKAGQFVSVVVPGAGPGGRDLRRAYSIASAPHIRPIELCVKLVEKGPGTNYLNRLRPGDTFKGFAPYGDFTYEPKPDRVAVFISTGTGVAPFRSMALSQEFAENPPLHTICLLGVREESEILYPDELRGIPGLEFICAVSQPVGNWEGFRGRVTDWLRRPDLSLDWANADFYLCGNGAMIAEVKTLLAEKGVAKEAIYQEKYY
jgi:ferredoxin-NADP reductase